MGITLRAPGSHKEKIMATHAKAAPLVRHDRPHAEDRHRARAIVLVWIDAREAVIVRSRGKSGWIERVESEVHRHHRSTGHVWHDPAFHGGGGWVRDAGEPHRLEHMRTFLRRVARRLPLAEDVAVIGPGVVHDRLAAELRDDDAEHLRTRIVATAPAPRMTARQLVAYRRRLAGEEPRRRTVGSWRWSGGTETGPRPWRLTPMRRAVRTQDEPSGA